MLGSWYLDITLSLTILYNLFLGFGNPSTRFLEKHLNTTTKRINIQSLPNRYYDMILDGKPVRPKKHKNIQRDTDGGKQSKS